ncbi:ABC transporter family protein [Paraburkholderia sp. BL10I2N1]|nr:ABC transporter family protein [Paraburkholderia sp. BL10I2N1]
MRSADTDGMAFGKGVVVGNKGQREAAFRSDLRRNGGGGQALSVSDTGRTPCDSSIDSRWRAARDEVVAMLERVGLGASLNKYPQQLSGGMQQRLAIAQAPMMKPRVLLLDEPFGALDPGIRRDMHVLLSELWRESMVTLFMVTHDLKEGFTLGSRVLVFDKVRIDPQAPGAYGAHITYDIPLDRARLGVGGLYRPGRRARRVSYRTGLRLNESSGL